MVVDKNIGFQVLGFKFCKTGAKVNKNFEIAKKYI
jgi:hypothetical protein